MQVVRPHLGSCHGDLVFVSEHGAVVGRFQSPVPGNEGPSRLSGLSPKSKGLTVLVCLLPHKCQPSDLYLFTCQIYSFNSQCWIMMIISKVHKMAKLRIIVGASLVAQWLGVCLPMQGTRVRALVWEDPTCCGAAVPVSHNYYLYLFIN